MGKPTLRRIIALAVLSVFLTGCFEYVPATLDALPDGQEVRLFVTEQGLSEASTVAQQDNGQPIVQGKLVSRRSDRLLLRIPTVGRQDGFGSDVLGQDVAIPLREIVQVERRRINRLATGLLVAGTAGVAATVIFMIMDAAGSATPLVVDTGEEAHAPLLSIPLR